MTPRRFDPLLSIVVLAGLLAYGTALAGTFVYDDLHSVRDNPALRDLRRIPEYFWNPATFSALDNRMYRPVLLVTFALDHALGGGAALPFKLTNLLLHVTCACLLVALARRFGAARHVAIGVGLLFATHPLLSEAVNMVSARSELLMYGFVLGALLCHERARSGSRACAWLAGLLTAFAAGAKEPGVVVPALLLLRERAVPAAERGRWRESLARIAPALGCAIAFLVVRRLVLGIATASVPAWSGNGDPLSGGSRGLVAQLATMALLLPRCLFQTLVPTGLSIDPSAPMQTTFWDPFVLSGAVGCCALALAVWHRGGPLARLGLAIAAAGSLPWIVLPLNVMLAEHRLYGLLAGGSLVLAEFAVRSRVAPVHLLRAATLVGLSFGAVSAIRSLDYRDERVLWEQVVAARPTSTRALCALGIGDLAAGDARTARQRLERAVGFYPRSWRARRYLAMAELALPREEGHCGLALVHAEHVKAQSPHDPFVRLLVAECLAAVGDQTGEVQWYRDAEREALSCLEIAEPKGLVYVTAARMRALAGDLRGALALVDTAIARGLDHSSVRLARCELLERDGRRDEAVAGVQAVLTRDPFDATAHALLARLQRAAPGR